jgi:hypothetical protein
VTSDRATLASKLKMPRSLYNSIRGCCRSRARYGCARPQPLIPAPVCRPRDESEREKAVRRRTGKRRDEDVAHSWTERTWTGVGRRWTRGAARASGHARPSGHPGASHARTSNQQVNLEICRSKLSSSEVLIGVGFAYVYRGEYFLRNS